ncbi:hypothetical protein EZ449_03555 [Pedobacter frigidisoli]|uniref:WG containing repeat-containing protein n=1 Tax=Pedobacter frigidisoli TaxID=2530455 RepID=A0A4R0P929_9SPHI|nr:hypothetical protein [Pedobacter frigidisoli]TCD12106.1 hypothetical protein EZ449_03555 [Pedobacter frigidisoli]
MKNLLIFTAVILFFFSSCAQEKTKEKTIADGQTKQNAIDQLIENINIFKSMLIHEKFEPETIGANNQYHDYETITQKVFDRDHITFSYQYPNTQIVIEYPKFDVENILANGYEFTTDFDNHIKAPKITPTTIYYADGTVTNAKDLNVKQQTQPISDYEFYIKGYKVIKAIIYAVETNFYKEKEYAITNEKQVLVTPLGKIEVRTFKKNGIALKVPGLLKDKLKILAQDKSSKYLSTIGTYYGNTEDLDIELKMFIDKLEKVKEQLNQGKINYKEVLENYSWKKVSDELNTKKKTLLLGQSFSAEISKVKLMVLDTTETEQKIYQLTSVKPLLNNGRTSLIGQQEKFGYAIAQDVSKKFGVIDLQGNWLIKPTFYELSLTNRQNIFSGKKENADQFNDYLLNKETKILSVIKE